MEAERGEGGRGDRKGRRVYVKGERGGGGGAHLHGDLFLIQSH